MHSLKNGYFSWATPTWKKGKISYVMTQARKRSQPTQNKGSSVIKNVARIISGFDGCNEHELRFYADIYKHLLTSLQIQFSTNINISTQQNKMREKTCHWASSIEPNTNHLALWRMYCDVCLHKFYLIQKYATTYFARFPVQWNFMFLLCSWFLLIFWERKIRN